MGEKWTAEYDEYGGYDCMSAGWDIRDASGDLIVTVDEGDFHGPDTDRCRKVAALITAAPDMLGALKAHIIYCETGLEVDFNHWAHLRDRAIAKAEDVQKIDK